MKWSTFALAAALAGALYGVPAWAQVPGKASPAYSSGYYQVAEANQASPSDATTGSGEATEEMMAMPAVDEAVAEEAAEEEDGPWRLINPGPRGWAFNFWLAQSFTGNTQSPADRFNGPVTWTDRSNDYQMNELWMSYFKNAEAEDGCWGLGGRVDMFYGTNYRWCTSAGLESNWNRNDFYGVALPSAYAEIATGSKVKTKVGHFISPVGWYTVGTANNFFNVIPYTYQYGEPFTHTGFLTQWQATDNLNVGGGLTNGWDSTANWDPTGTDLGNAGVTNPWNRHAGLLMTATLTNIATEGDSFAYVGVYGLEPDITTTTRTERYFQTLVYQAPVTERLQYILQSDFGNQLSALGPGVNAQWYGVNQYLYWKYNDCWSWGLGFEWFRDDDGFRVGQVVPSFGSPNARGLARGPFEGNFYRLTFGPRWTPHQNVIIRPTLLYDSYDGPGATGAPAVRPFNDGLNNRQFLMNIDMVLLF